MTPVQFVNLSICVCAHLLVFVSIQSMLFILFIRGLSMVFIKGKHLMPLGIQAVHAGVKKKKK